MQLFSKDQNLLYCTADGPIAWRIFINSSKLSLKAVLLCSGNRYPLVSLAHTVNMKETYENTKLLLNRIQYERCLWIARLQPGYTKFCCFLCEWDRKAKATHYVQKNGFRDHMLFREKKANGPLADRKKIFLPPLHIKLDLIKNLVKASNKDREAFKHLKTKFPRISEATLNEGISVGPQIREIFKDPLFTSKLVDEEKRACF